MTTICEDMDNIMLLCKYQVALGKGTNLTFEEFTMSMQSQEDAYMTPPEERELTLEEQKAAIREEYTSTLENAIKEAFATPMLPDERWAIITVFGIEPILKEVDKYEYGRNTGAIKNIVGEMAICDNQHDMEYYGERLLEVI